MNEDLKPFLQKVQDGIDGAAEAVTEQLRVAKETYDDIMRSLRELQALAPQNPRARAAAAAAARGIGYLEGACPVSSRPGTELQRRG